jgi:hypothetical protein
MPPCRGDVRTGRTSVDALQAVVTDGQLDRSEAIQALQRVRAPRGQTGWDPSWQPCANFGRSWKYVI